MSIEHTYAKTINGYEALIFNDVVFALAGVVSGNSAQSKAQWNRIRKWGLKQFPTFRLSTERLAEAVEMANVIRQRAHFTYEDVVRHFGEDVTEPIKESALVVNEKADFEGKPSGIFESIAGKKAS